MKSFVYFCEGISDGMRKLERKRQRMARVLLTVFLTMLMVTTFHHHGLSQHATVCKDCATHQMHSAHLTVADLTLDDCLLCQLCSTPYLSADIQSRVFQYILLTPTHALNTAIRPQSDKVYYSLRAPPAIS